MKARDLNIVALDQRRWVHEQAPNRFRGQPLTSGGSLKPARDAGPSAQPFRGSKAETSLEPSGGALGCAYESSGGGHNTYPPKQTTYPNTSYDSEHFMAPELLALGDGGSAGTPSAYSILKANDCYMNQLQTSAEGNL